MQRLEEACPGVAAAIRVLLLQKPSSHEPKLVSVGEASPGWVRRASDRERTRTSTLDLLHDFLYETDLYESNMKDDSDYRAQIIEKLGQWRGALHSEATEAAAAAAAAAAGGGEAPKPPPSSSAVETVARATETARRAEAAAALYLDLVRQLEGKFLLLRLTISPCCMQSPV